MRKIYILFALISVLVSCSEWKYSKGVKWERPEYHAAAAKASRQQQAHEARDAALTAVEESDAAIPEETDISSPSQSTLPAPAAGRVRQSDREIPAEATILVKEDDTLSGDVSEEAVSIALHAESQGRKSRTLGIVSLVLTFTYIFALVGLVLAIIGLAKGVNSLKAGYNTPKGVGMARTGVVTSAITIGLNVLAILLIVTLILLLI